MAAGNHEQIGEIALKALKITAHLYNGFAASDNWSPALDGILAYWKLYLADPDYFLLTQGRSDLMTPVERLPLERIEDGDWWWYACSAPIYTLHQMQRIHFHRRFDDQHEQFLPEGTKSILTAAGPFKNYRKSIIFRVTDKIVWHVVGDRNEIQTLLNHCNHVGAKPAQGFGRVKRWEITDDADLQTALYQRPLPMGYAQVKGIKGAIMRWGIRPPARLPVNVTLCIMPECTHAA